MNTSRPTLPRPADVDLIHSSIRTFLSTNANADTSKPARVTMRVSRLEVHWLDGDVAVRFAGSELDVTPSGARPARRGR